MDRTEQELKRLNDQLRAARKVDKTIKTKGWKDIVQPIIDKMIMDTLGGKVGNTWVNGAISKPDTVKESEYYIGYKQALIDFNNRIWNYKECIKTIQDRIKEVQERGGEVNRLRQPFEGGKYAHDGGG
jgi:hypothetical protein